MIILSTLDLSPCFHSSAPITFLIHMGNEGSIIAIPMLANVMEPERKILYENDC